MPGLRDTTVTRQSRARVGLLALLFAASCGTPSDAQDKTHKTDSFGRPARWAAPLQRPGLPNLHRVSEGLYRGAQPDKPGFSELKAMGIRTVVNLRSLHSDRSECAESGLDYVKIPMHAWHAEDEDVAAILAVITDPARQPVFVHCQHGADRTGIACAAYRIAVDGWSNEEAIREMAEGGYGFHAVWENLISYVRGLDAEKLRAARHR